MYDPYPHKISKIKVSTLFLVSIILAIIFFSLRSNPELIHISKELVSSLQYLKYLLLIALLLFSAKTFSLLYSREYIFLASGIASYLLIQLFYHVYFANQFNGTILPFVESSFSRISESVFFILFIIKYF